MTVAHRASGGGYGSVTGTVTVTVVDDDTLPPGLLFSPQRFDVGEGDTATYRLSLAALPTSAVTVTVSSGDTGALAVPASFVFTTSNWNQPRTVTVRGVQDYDRDDETVTVTHRSSGGGYGSVTGTVTVTVVDDDTLPPGYVLSPQQLSVDEGDTATYTLRLATEPTGAVTVALSSGDTGALAVPVSFVFTNRNWYQPRTVTVRGVEDDDTADETVTVTHRSSGGGFGPLTGTVTVTVVDDDTLPPALVLSPQQLTVGEGDTATYTLSLATQPTAAVTSRCRDTGALAVPASFVFTASNWNQPRTVTVRGVDDDDTSDETVTVTHDASRGGYGGVTGTVTVTVIDDDTLPPGLLFTPQRFDVDEGDTATYRLSLAALPTGPVTVAVSSGDTGALAVPVSFVFTASNWNQPRTVTVRGVEDDDRDDETVTVTHRASGGGYGSVTGHGDGDGDRRRHAAAGSVVHAAALRRRRGRHRDLPAEPGGAAHRSGDGGGVLGRHRRAGGAGELRVHRLELEPAPHGDGARRGGRRPRRRDGGGHAPRVGRRLRVGDRDGDGDGGRRRHAAAGSVVHAAALRRRRGRHRDLPAEFGGAADRSGDGGGVLGRHGGAGGAGEFRVHRLELEPAPHGDGARRGGRRPRRRDGGGHAPRVGRRLRVGDRAR